MFSIIQKMHYRFEGHLKSIIITNDNHGKVIDSINKKIYHFY